MRHFENIPVRKILAMRPLAKPDLARLREPRAALTVKRMKDSHHFLARLFAAGMTVKQVAQTTGRSYHAVLTIRKSPAFEQLVAEYRGMVNESWLEQLDGYTEVATANMLRAELAIADKLADYEEDPENNRIGIRDLMAISRDAADRFGYGKHSTQTNVNVDFAAQLERAIRRSGKGPTIVEVKAQEGGQAIPAPSAPPIVPSSSGVAGAGDDRATTPVIPLPLGLRRRA